MHPPREGISPVSFLVPRRFSNPPTLTHVRFLGLCFKMGRMESPPTNTTRRRTVVSAGAITPPTGLRLEGHIYVADKGDYYDIADGLPQQAQS